jgi:predicted DNA-binding mobile mystery protein A
MTKRLGAIQLRQLEDRLRVLREFAAAAPPPDGWIRTIRQALGMSTEQLAYRMQVTRQAVLQMEAAESKQTVTWTTLRRAAAAMDCEVVYAIVPKGSLQQVLLKQGRKQAERHLQRIGHSMKLDAHMVGPAEQERQVEELAWHLAAERSKSLWAPEPEAAKPAPKPPRYHGRVRKLR